MRVDRIAAPARDGWWRSLAARAAVAVGILLAGLGATLTATATVSARRDAGELIARAVVADAARIAAALADRAPSSFALSDAVADLDLAYAFLATREGATFGDRPAAAPPQVQASDLVETQATGVAALTVTDDVAHAAKALTLADGARATLWLGRSLGAADAAADHAAARGLLATLVFLALALPAVGLLVDRMTAPLRALTRAVARPGSGAAAVARAGARRDEIGALARAHLAMTRNLADSADALRRLTFDDPLTRLPNRESLTHRIAAALQVGQPVALLKISVDGLARVATGLGHERGDAAVVAAAERLKAAAAEWQRRSDALAPLGSDLDVFVARTGESEFALLAHGAAADAADALARLALAAFESPLALGEHRVTLALGIGVALGPADGDEAATLVRSAAAALDAARTSGVQTVRFAAEDLNSRAYGRLRLEQELRRAIEQGELEVHFQPQIALRADRVVGAEALVRWRHPTRGLVAPGEFVPVAEESGLVEPLGRFVLREACRRSAGWAALGLRLRIAVNVSTVQFRNPRFAETVLGIIRDAAADPKLIELEITESTAMDDSGHAARELGRLRAAGVRIAIDDFGTGYSNLATLTQLPFDVLKVDRSFVRDALETPSARVVVATVLGMAASLGVESVAEGVETEAQRRFVMDNGCTLGQGYLFAKPMAAEAFEAWCRARLGDELRALRATAAAARGQPKAAAADAWSGAPRFAE